VNKPEISEYDDYRKYLSDFYSFFKKTRRGFSFRSFSKDAGFSSPNFLKLVIEGKRNLTSNSLHRFSRALKLSRSETEFFDSLVKFNQSRSLDEKNRHYEHLRRLRRYKDVKALEPTQFDYYSAWYHIAIRELTNLSDFKNDADWISEKLLPRISSKDASEALALLLKLGMIKKDGRSGKFKATDSTVTTGPEVKSLAVTNFHREMLERAVESIDTVPPLERDISSATLSIKESDLEKLKTRLVKFRREILATFDLTDGTADRIYQLNVQLFPISKK
jgi:uncharacterized protein (TIGR02147 family)